MMSRSPTGRGRTARRVMLSLTADEHASMLRAARAAGLPVATWARLRAVEAARQSPERDTLVRAALAWGDAVERGGYDEVVRADLLVDAIKAAKAAGLTE